MKALVLMSPRKFEYHNTSKPEVPQGWALVKVTKVSVCGSDFHSFRGENALLSYPRIMGHEVCGEIEFIQGSSEAFKQNDKVILMPYLSCGTCVACKKGKTNCCTSLSVYGVHRDGAMADYYVAPLSQLIKIDASIDDEVASLIEPLAISTHAVHRADIKAGETVVISGAGPIGIGAGLVSRALGATVILQDINDVRLTFARKAFRFEHTLNSAKEGYKEKLLALTHGDGPDKIIDSSGNHLSMENNVNILSYGGRMVYVGISNQPIALDGTAFHKRETELFDSRAAFRSDFDEVITLIKEGKIEPRNMITHRSDFDHALESFVQWEHLGGEVFKAVISMTEK